MRQNASEVSYSSVNTNVMREAIRKETNFSARTRKANTEGKQKHQLHLILSENKRKSEDKMYIDERLRQNKAIEKYNVRK